MLGGSALSVSHVCCCCDRDRRFCRRNNIQSYSWRSRSRRRKLTRQWRRAPSRPPTAAKKVIQVGGGGAEIGTAGGFHEWIVAHPLETGALALGIVVMIGGTIYAINRKYQARQEAPTPGIAVVPEKAAA